MIKQFEKLTKNEQELLSKAPVLVSILAAIAGNEISKMQKADAIKLAHLKTFTAVPLLLPYYAEVEKTFKEQFETAIKKYSPFDKTKLDALKKELGLVNQIIAKLDKNFGETLHESLSGYARHVKKAEHSILEDFIFPMPLSGLTN